MSTPAIAPPGGGPPVSPATIQLAVTESSFVIHSPPDIPTSAEVIGVCAVPQHLAGRDKYGWMVDDFISWKSILHDSTETSQTWLSTIDIPKFLKQDKVAINGAQRDESINGIVSLPSDHHDCAESLFKHIRERALPASNKKVPLLIMVFAPITPEQDIIFDFGGSKAYVTTDRIRKTVRDSLNHENIRVTLVTPSPFSAGWMCHPTLFPRPYDANQSLIRVVAKSCGAALADPLIRSYTTRRSPVLSHEQRANAQYDDIMPIQRTDTQVSLMYHFHRKIHDILEHRLSPLGADRGFNFDMDKDAWQTYGARRGISLDEWKMKWNPAENIDVDGRFDFLGQAFGGSRSSQLFHVKYLVQIEFETCHYDWDKSVTGRTKKLFVDFLVASNEENEERVKYPDNEPVKRVSEEATKRVLDAMEYRSSSMIMTHVVAKGLGLPFPGSDGGVKSKCRFWKDEYTNREAYARLQQAFSKIRDVKVFEEAALFPGEIRHDFNEVRFHRASRWLATAVATKFANGSRQEMEDFVQKEILPFVHLIRETQSQLLLQVPVVVQFGLDWIASLPNFNLGSGPGMSTNTVTLRAQAQPFVSARIPSHIPITAPMTIDTSPFATYSGAPHLSENGIVSGHGHLEVSPSRSSGSNVPKPPTDGPATKPREVAVVNMPVKSIVDGPIVKVAVSRPDEEGIAKPVLLTTNEAVGPFQRPFDKPVKNVTHTVAKPDVKFFVKSPVKPLVEPIAKPIVDPFNKSAMEPFHEPVGKPMVQPSQQLSEGQRLEALLMGSLLPTATFDMISPAKASLFSLSHDQIAKALQDNPNLMVRALTMVMGKLNLGGGEEQVTTATTPSAIASGPAAAVTEADEENTNTTWAGRVATEVRLHDPSAEPLGIHDPSSETFGIHDPSVETWPATAARVNPTPPQTPIAGRTIGNPATTTGLHVGATTQQASAGGARLAGPEDFFLNIKKHPKW